jgi:hypothetical protein
MVGVKPSQVHLQNADLLEWSKFGHVIFENIKKIFFYKNHDYSLGDHSINYIVTTIVCLTSIRNKIYIINTYCKWEMVASNA